MAPSAAPVESTAPATATKNPKPIRQTGVLDKYESFDVTPVAGREFPTANLAEWLNAPNADELIRDLAITISERGVVFFRAQDDLTDQLQKKLITKLGQLTCRPATSSLHIHPLLNPGREGGGDDPEISTISSKQHKAFYRAPEANNGVVVKKRDNEMWHADISFENVTADYSSLRLTELPPTGGDTLWASGYEVYDRLSPAYQRFFESLTATFQQPISGALAAKGGFELFAGPRGSPENVGTDLKAIHPVVRSHPITGWRSVFPIGAHVSHFNDLTMEENITLMKWLYETIASDHSLQVRHKWKTPNDIAIWDNRCMFHTATFDYTELGDRFGVRVVGIGEKPYFDPQSKSRRDDLEQREK